MEQNGLSNFGRGSPKEPSCKIISKSVKPFLRSRLKQKVNNARTTDKDWSQSSGELKTWGLGIEKYGADLENWIGGTILQMSMNFNVNEFQCSSVDLWTTTGYLLAQMKF